MTTDRRLEEIRKRWAEKTLVGTYTPKVIETLEFHSLGWLNAEVIGRLAAAEEDVAYLLERLERATKGLTEEEIAGLIEHPIHMGIHRRTSLEVMLINALREARADLSATRTRLEEATKLVERLQTGLAHALATGTNLGAASERVYRAAAADAFMWLRGEPVVGESE